MNIEYRGALLAAIVPFPEMVLGQGFPQAWVWVPLWKVKESNNDHLQSWYQNDEDSEKDKSPVVLGFSIKSPSTLELIPMLNPFPLPQIGEYAMVENAANGISSYHIQQLPLEARQRWAALGDALRKLSSPLEWPQFRQGHAIAYDATIYQLAINSLTTQRMLTYGDTRADLLIEEALLEAARIHVQQLDAALNKTDWQSEWKEVQCMASDLAQDYYSYHLKKQKEYMLPLPDLTTSHQTIAPSSEHARGLIQSFGPIVNHGLWNTEDSIEQQLTTPNGARLAARGENGHEQKALHTFIEGGMGVEGIKYMVSLLAAYRDQTGAINRKDDARVTLRQLLIYMGRGDHADDLDEQQKLMHYILYLSRTWVTALEKDQSGRRRGRPSKTYREYTPLVVLEALGSDERGSIRVPDAVEFHLGKEFWDQMFGQHQHFFTIPTTLILQYHSVRQQQEICLALYLSNMLNLNSGTFAVHFPVLLTQTGLQDQDSIDRGTNRTRDALRTIYALEQLEKDHLIIREAHPNIDTVLGVELYSNATNKKHMSDATLTRIYNSYRYFQRFSPAELKTRRRVALQHLLDTVKDNSIKFRSGSLINTQIEKRTQGRQVAIDRREQAQRAGRTLKKGKTGQ